MSFTSTLTQEVKEMVVTVLYNCYVPFPYYTGVWSCPATSGERPPPCDAFTFTAVDCRRVVAFGGYSGEHHRLMNDIYILDLSTLV